MTGDLRRAISFVPPCEAIVETNKAADLTLFPRGFCTLHAAETSALKSKVFKPNPDHLRVLLHLGPRCRHLPPASASTVAIFRSDAPRAARDQSPLSLHAKS